MPEHFIFHAVFLSQIFLISFYYPRKIYGRMRYVLKTYPPSMYPKLYPKPIQCYEIAQRRYRNMNIFILSVGLLILVALLGNEHDGDLGNAIALGYFLVQMFPVMLLDLSSLKELKRMRESRLRTIRKAELHRRRLFDFISPTLISIVAITFVAFVFLILYIEQFEYSWFGGYWNIVGITIMNIFFAGIVCWNMYGKKLNPHQAYEDRTTQIATIAKIMAFTSIAATVFVSLSIALSALDVRHVLPIFLSLYFQLLAVISFQAYSIDFKNFDVYKEDTLVT